MKTEGRFVVAARRVALDAAAAMLRFDAVPNDETSSEPTVTVSEAARLLQMAESTVYAWVKDGTLASEERSGSKMIRRSVLRATKLLREVDVLGRSDVKSERITDSDIARAVDAGAARPTDIPRRYSLDDVETIIAFKNGTWAAPIGATAEAAPAPRAVAAAAPGGAVAPDAFEIRSGRWNALLDYIGVHHDAFKIPPTFWETCSCPDFVPPAGVHQYTDGIPLEDESLGPVIPIRRSAGWSVENGHVTRVPADDCVSERQGLEGWRHGRESPEYEAANIHYRELRSTWEQAYALRRRQLIAEGVRVRSLPDPPSIARRDRQAMLERYRLEGWAPSDLPDWFWDADECPPFEAPAEVCYFDYGEQGPDPDNPTSGVIGTYIRRTGLHHWTFSPPSLVFSPGSEHHDWVPGAFTRGDVPSKYEREMQNWRVAEFEWKQEYGRRKRMRDGSA